jgi:hypothetical protein
MSANELRDKLTLIRGGLENSGGGGDDGDMETLVRRVDAVEKDLVAIRERMAGIEGKLSNMPTTFQMMTWFVGVAMALVGLTFTIAKVIGAH